MKFLFIFLFGSMLSTDPMWLTDFNIAKQQAQEEHKMILLNFSGSDWCGPCIRLRKEIFESAAFKAYAGEQLVLVNADFPRSRKNKLSNEQEGSNNRLAEEYNRQGAFPLTLLLNSNGKIVNKWDGFPKDGPEAFIHELKNLVDANK